MDEGKDDDDEYNMFTTTNQPLVLPVTLDGVNLIIEIDTGAAKSVISENTFAQLWPNHKAPSVKPTSVTLKTYTNEKIKPVGVSSVSVEVNRQTQQLTFLIVPADDPSLFGHDWLAYVRLEWAQLHVQMNCKHSLTRILLCSNLSLD